MGEKVEVECSKEEMVEMAFEFKIPRSDRHQGCRSSMAWK
jgi:hypothetical protein